MLPEPFIDALRCIDSDIAPLGEVIMQRETMCVVLELIGNIDADSTHANATLAPQLMGKIKFPQTARC